MKAVALLRTRIAFSETAFAELALWQVPKPVAPLILAGSYGKGLTSFDIMGITPRRYRQLAGQSICD